MLQILLGFKGLYLVLSIVKFGKESLRLVMNEVAEDLERVPLSNFFLLKDFSDLSDALSNVFNLLFSQLTNLF